MDYKQKCEQLTKFIKDLYPHMSDYCKEKTEGIFPELKESEDERIRKVLIQYIKYNVSVISGWRKKELIAWLEKQGEQIDIVNKEYWRGYREGKQLILDKYADLEKQDEQKPAEWSEEDEGMLQKTLSTIRYALSIPMDKEDDPCFVGSSTISWLKSIKQRMKGE